MAARAPDMPSRRTMLMDRKTFIRETQAVGWRLFATHDGGLAFQCSRIGCAMALYMPDSLIDCGTIPGPCDQDHDGEYSRDLIESYDDLIRVLRSARQRYGLSQMDIDAAAGLADAHTAKLEIKDRRATLPTLMIWAATLGYEIALIPIALPRQTISIIDHRAGRPIDPRIRQALILPPDHEETE